MECASQTLIKEEVMGEGGQVIPLAHAADRSSSDEEDPRWKSSSNMSKRRLLPWCACFIGTILILALVILVLALTVFKIKEPEMAMNSIKIDRMNLNVAGLSSALSLNLTLTADVSVKNPNAASFKFDNSTTILTYRGKTVGEAHTPAGKALARRTLRMNVTVDVNANKLVGDQNLISDVASGALTVSSYTKISGRVSIIKIIKRGVVVVMNCTVSVSVSNQEIQDQACVRMVKL
ncbi:uncharacterized protein LOC131238777 [Magnolia sinica]|uniref:uncharacterized protein LOC131238777 n=1 Tax=Magnolia sinica TaxID=86752 RepID=UPI002658F6D4|nr:uncharacterized protein LOC131238777 [Magnolia sinica]